MRRLTIEEFMRFRNASGKLNTVTTVTEKPLGTTLVSKVQRETFTKDGKDWAVIVKWVEGAAGVGYTIYYNYFLERIGA